MAVNVIAVLPCVLMGMGGGLMGSMFTQLNVLIAKWRKRFMQRIKSAATSNALRVLEPVLIIVIMTSIHVYLPRQGSVDDGMTTLGGFHLVRTQIFRLF